MAATLGSLGVWIAFVAAILGAGLTIRDLLRRRKGRPAAQALDGRLLAPVVLVGGVIATAAMQWALIHHDFSILYVADNNAKETPLIYSITAMGTPALGLPPRRDLAIPTALG